MTITAWERNVQVSVRTGKYRWHWLDALADLAGRHDLLDVASTDEARDALAELHEGPWDEPLAEALTRRDELDAEIGRMVREAAGESTVDGAA